MKYPTGHDDATSYLLSCRARGVPAHQAADVLREHELSDGAIQHLLASAYGLAADEAQRIAEHRGNSTITGHDAIEIAERHGVTLSKYNDPTEPARTGLTPEQAREIAAEDPSLVYLPCGTTAALLRWLNGPKDADGAYRIEAITGDGDYAAIGTRETEQAAAACALAHTAEVERAYGQRLKNSRTGRRVGDTRVICPDGTTLSGLDLGIAAAAEPR